MFLFIAACGTSGPAPHADAEHPWLERVSDGVQQVGQGRVVGTLARPATGCSTTVVSFVVAAGIDLFYAIAERDRIPGRKPDHRSECYLPGGSVPL